jgi:hypothetical protein
MLAFGNSLCLSDTQCVPNHENLSNARKDDLIYEVSAGQKVDHHRYHPSALRRSNRNLHTAHIPPVGFGSQSVQLSKFAGSHREAFQQPLAFPTRHDQHTNAGQNSESLKPALSTTRRGNGNYQSPHSRLSQRCPQDFISSRMVGVGEPLVVFLRTAEQQADATRYGAAASMLQFGLAVAAADGHVDEEGSASKLNRCNCLPRLSLPRHHRWVSDGPCRREHCLDRLQDVLALLIGCSQQ